VGEKGEEGGVGMGGGEKVIEGVGREGGYGGGGLCKWGGERDGKGSGGGRGSA